MAIKLTPTAQFNHADFADFAEFAELGDAPIDACHVFPEPLNVDDIALARAEQNARSAALETEALYQAHCDNAAQACWYLCRSLGLARQMEAGGEPTLELLFQLLGALTDLPADIASQPMPEQVGADSLGVFELCQQLTAAREQSQEAWADADLAAPANALPH
ncbi:hypothetical protein [Roseateles koreensis]|uniref:Uncharacterized protein n=1 Tax=Roseateles koreensis TaxID=2987526 RepID=A0ABT5KPE8_9BURK|nr:hypothetical protein [Roseateles koreensis]MDC8784779.1 hypothetical protein [Roseateles koreensis]